VDHRGADRERECRIAHCVWARTPVDAAGNGPPAARRGTHLPREHPQLGERGDGVEDFRAVARESVSAGVWAPSAMMVPQAEFLGPGKRSSD